MKRDLLRIGAALTLLISFLGLVSGTSVGRVRARVAASCSPTDVQRAVDAADIGGTVTLPSCTYMAWGTTVSITKPITLEGQGTHQTILRRQAGGALIMFQVTGVTGFEMRNLTLDGTYDTDPNVHQDLGLALLDVVDFRIHGGSVRRRTSSSRTTRLPGTGMLLPRTTAPVTSSDSTPLSTTEKMPLPSMPMEGESGREARASMKSTGIRWTTSCPATPGSPLVGATG